jgi:hypothetical protein
MTNTSINYNHPRRSPLGSAPVRRSIVLQAGQTVTLTGPNAGQVRTAPAPRPGRINYSKGA